jgi:hypothetical protein
MTRLELENLCDVVATVEVDWIVRTSFSRAIRDHDQAQRQVIEAQDKLIEAMKDLSESLKQEIEQQATELTCWRETAKAVGAVDDHALALHLDEQAQEIGRLREMLGALIKANDNSFSGLADWNNIWDKARETLQASHPERSEG